MIVSHHDAAAITHMHEAILTRSRPCGSVQRRSRIAVHTWTIGETLQISVDRRAFRSVDR